MILIKNFPLAPSVNGYLKPVPGSHMKMGKKGLYLPPRMVKTKHHRDYVERCNLWAALNRETLEPIKKYLDNLRRTKEGQKLVFALEVTCYFIFEETRLITANKKSEQLDVDNRLKPTLDALKMVLGIDDKVFFRASCEKVTTHSKDLECTVIKIKHMTPTTLDSLSKQLGMSLLGS